MRALPRLILASAMAAVALTPAPASAVTVNEIIAMSKAGVSERVILAVIERDQTILAVEPDTIVALKREGVSDAVVTAMLRSGRDRAEAVANAESQWTASSIMAGLSTKPDVVIVGHGPDRPNAGAYGEYYPGYGYYAGYVDPGAVAVPYAVPYVVPLNAADRRFRRGARHQASRPAVDAGAPSADTAGPGRPQSPAAVPPDAPARGTFFTDGGARGIFFPR
jgi:hypothetical protein